MALPEELTAIRAQIEDADSLTVTNDRANYADYVVGAALSMDQLSLNEWCRRCWEKSAATRQRMPAPTLSPSFGSVNCVMMVGVAAGGEKIGEATMRAVDQPRVSQPGWVRATAPPTDVLNLADGANRPAPHLDPA